MQRVSVDEPWRYTCPDCGSVRVYKRLRRQRPEGKKYKQGAVGVKNAEYDRNMLRFYCDSCGCGEAGNFDGFKEKVYDKKYDSEVSSV